MKKLLFLMIVVISLPAHARDNAPIRFYLNFADLGIGTNVPFNSNNTNGELLLTLINF